MEKGRDILTSQNVNKKVVQLRLEQDANGDTR